MSEVNPTPTDVKEVLDDLDHLIGDQMTLLDAEATVRSEPNRIKFAFEVSEAQGKLIMLKLLQDFVEKRRQGLIDQSPKS